MDPSRDTHPESPTRTSLTVCGFLGTAGRCTAGAWSSSSASSQVGVVGSDAGVCCSHE